MSTLKKFGEYLYRKQFTWLEFVILFFIGVAAFSYNLKAVEFYVDENPWIYESAALNSFWEADFRPGLWEDEYNGMLDPPMAKYLIGVGIKLGRVSIESLPRWDWALDTQSNIARGCIPSAEVLWWARLPMLVTSVLGLLLAASLVSRLHSRLAAFVFYGFCLTHFTYPLQQAMSEAPLVFFTFLAGLVGYQGIIALSEKQYQSVFICFSMFGVLTGLAAASKMNAIAILFAGILCIGYVLFRGRMDELRQGIRLAVRLIVAQTYLIIAIFILINPYLYTSPFRKIALMSIARTFTLQVQMKMYPQSVVTLENWLRIVPGRIFDQLSTLAYPGHYLINIFLFCVGVYVVVHALWNKSPGWEAGLILGTFSVVLAVPGMFSPLDWNRYYLFPVLFSRVFIAVGLAKVFSVVIPKNGTMLKNATQTAQLNLSP